MDEVVAPGSSTFCFLNHHVIWEAVVTVQQASVILCALLPCAPQPSICQLLQPYEWGPLRSKQHAPL